MPDEDGVNSVSSPKHVGHLSVSFATDLVNVTRTRVDVGREANQSFTSILLTLQFRWFGFGGSLDALEAIAGEERLTTRWKLLGWTSQRPLSFKVIECVSICLFRNFIDFVCLLCNCLVVTDNCNCFIYLFFQQQEFLPI